MKHSYYFLATAFLLVYVISASAQGPAATQQFSREGVTFNYPTGWAFSDSSTQNAVEMTFGNANLDANLRFFVFRTPLTSPEKLAEARKILVDRYIDATTKSFAGANAKPVSSPSTSEIAAIKAEGVKIKATLNSIARTTEIEWAVVENRMVVLTMLGPDKEFAKAAPLWDMVRTTLKIEPLPKPAPATTPTPKKP